jgi:hypothetical protein
MKKYEIYIQTYKDYLKSKYIDFFKRGDRLVTPMQLLISTLDSRGYLPEKIIAVELFGMHGLWITKDYANICSYLELYEINPTYANFAKKFIRNAKVITGD